MTSADLVRVIARDQPASRFTPEIVGNKAANLYRLNRLGLRVPPAIVLTTAACREYLAAGTLPAVALAELADALRLLEDATGLTLGGRRPLVVSVRSSPPTSMPGLLKTVLNVGLTEERVGGLIGRTGNPWLAWDAYRRLVRSFGEIVRGTGTAGFDARTKAHLARAGAQSVQELDALSLSELARESARLLEDTNGALPEDAFTQVAQAVEAVLASWNSTAARSYRRGMGMGERAASAGTAVLVQAMVFGNGWYRSGSGAAFTRNPSTGAPGLYVDFLPGAQGEDISSGHDPVSDHPQLQRIMPDIWAELEEVARALELEFGDMQDFEFTVEDGLLHILQTRAGRRTPWAALQIAVDLAQAGIIDRAIAVERLAGVDVRGISRLAAAPGTAMPLAQAITGSAGVATGAIALDGASAQQLASAGQVILVRPSIATGDLRSLSSVQGIVTTFGRRTSHAAVIAREQGTVCLVGCADLRVDDAARLCWFGSHAFHEGDVITLDGDRGLIYEGHIPAVVERPAEAAVVIEAWRTEARAPASVSTPAR